MIIRKRVEGKIQYNDGQFAEIQTVGLEGPEKGLHIDDIQVDRSETHDTPGQFQRRFPVGMWLDITTTTEFRLRESPHEGERIA
jgi:hypothetical protein